MAPRQRRPSSSVIAQLQKKTYAYEYVQAVRLLECLTPDSVPLGEGVFPDQEAVAFQSRIFLDWPSGDLYALEKSPKASPAYTLSVNFLGLAGAQGPLPLPLTERLLDNQRRKDTAGIAFLNIFNHRLLSLVYRIRKKYNVGLQRKEPQETPLAASLFALMGLREHSLRHRLKIPDRALLCYAGLLWQYPRSLKGCEVLLKDYFKVPVQILPFKGKWRILESHEHTRIGFSGSLNTLGETAALGKRVWDSTGFFHIQIGPLSWEMFQGFLKGGALYDALRELLTLYFPLFQDFIIGLILKPSERPQCLLGNQSLLGWSTWIGHSQKTDDPVCLYIQGSS